MAAADPVAELLGRLRAADEATRLAAIAGLGEAAAPRSAAALVALLTDAREPARVRDAAFDALTRLGPAAAPALPELVAALRHPVPAVRLYAGWVMQAIGPPARSAVPGLLAALADSAEPVAVRVAAARTLGLVGGGDAAPGTAAALAATLGDADRWVRLYAARTLAEIAAGAAAAVPALRRALRDADHNVRRAAALALASAGDAAPETVASLIGALGDADAGGVAAEALAGMGGRALPALAAALRRGDDPTAALAAYALSKTDAPDARAALAAWVAGGGVPFAPALADFYSRHPPVDLDGPRVAAFEGLLAAARAAAGGGTGALVDYRLPYPKHEFLHYLAHRKGLVLHGSNRRELRVLEPRRALGEGDEAALDVVYAARSAFVLVFAITDRARVFGMRVNAFPAAAAGADGRREWVHEYALNADAVRERHFRPGMVYALPEGAFEHLPRSGVWVARRPVAPAVRVPVEPEDFPLLDELLGFEPIYGGWEPIRPGGSPFLQDARTYLVRAPRRPPTGARSR